MKILRMKEEYIDWVKQGRKIATTRTESKGVGFRELASESYYKTKKSGVVVNIVSCLPWTRRFVPPYLQWFIADAEGFSSFTEFWEVLVEINRKKKNEINNATVFYTHFFGVVSK